MAEKDPFTLVYEAFWTLLEAESSFTALVPATHRIKYADAAKEPSKHPAQFAQHRPNYCQVRVVTLGGPACSRRCSAGAFNLTDTWQVEALSGDHRLCYLHEGVYNGINPVRWAVLRAMTPWESTLQALTWNGVAGFVKACSPFSFESKMASPRLEEQVKPYPQEGWNALWRGYVDMWFTDSDLE